LIASSNYHNFDPHHCHFYFNSIYFIDCYREC